MYYVQYISKRYKNITANGHQQPRRWITICSSKKPSSRCPERLPPYASSPKIIIVGLLGLCRIISQSSIYRNLPGCPVLHPLYSPRFIVGSSVDVAARITCAGKADEDDVWNVFVNVLLVIGVDRTIIIR